MNPILDEELIPLRHAPDHLPRTDGRKVHIATVVRWAVHGLGGVRLETVRVGGRRFTSLPALRRFIAQQNERPGRYDAAAPPEFHVPYPLRRPSAKSVRASVERILHGDREGHQAVHE